MVVTSQELEACKEIIKEKRLPQEVSKILEREDLPISEKTIGLVIEALKKLSLVKAMLQNEDLLKSGDYELDATKLTVNEAYNLLDSAASLHFKTH
jgi:hypothetical protein